MIEPSASVARTTLVVVGILLAVAAALWLLFTLLGILFLLFLAVVFGFLLGPLIKLLQRRVRLGRWSYALPLPGAIGAAYVLLFGSIAAAVVLLLPVVNDQLTDFMREAPGYVTRVEHRWQDWLQGHTRAFPRETRAAIDRGVQVGLAAAEEALEKRVLPRAVGWLGRAPWLALIPVLTFFLFRDAALFREAALDALGSRRLKRRGEALLEDVSRALAAYIRAQLIACAMVGTVCTAYYLAIGLPYGVVLGVGAGILEFVPFVGPLTAGLAALAAGALTSRGEAAAVLAFLFVLRIVQDDIVYPRLVGREVHLHPLAVILAILCGGEVAGVAGIFAAVPLVTVLKVALRHWKEHRAAQAARAADAASGARSA